MAVFSRPSVLRAHSLTWVQVQAQSLLLILLIIGWSSFAVHIPSHILRLHSFTVPHTISLETFVDLISVQTVYTVIVSLSCQNTYLVV